MPVIRPVSGRSLENAAYTTYPPLATPLFDFYSSCADFFTAP